MTYSIQLQLLSDATFGRGDGVTDLVDQEVEHDTCGLPFLRGRTLKGLLSEECDNLIAVRPAADRDTWLDRRFWLFGRPGSDRRTTAGLHIGDARLPVDLRDAIARDLAVKPPAYTASDVLHSLTVIRHQTAIDAMTGIPDQGSLRTMRVVIRDLVFTSLLDFVAPPDDAALALLAAGCMALRRVGTGRNRGRGAVRCTLHSAQDGDITVAAMQQF